MTVCRKLDKTFECALNDGSSPFKLKQTFPPNAFPQVTDLYDWNRNWSSLRITLLFPKQCTIKKLHNKH